MHRNPTEDQSLSAGLTAHMIRIVIDVYHILVHQATPTRNKSYLVPLILSTKCHLWWWLSLCDLWDGISCRDYHHLPHSLRYASLPRCSQLHRSHTGSRLWQIKKWPRPVLPRLLEPRSTDACLAIRAQWAITSQILEELPLVPGWQGS